MSCLIWNEFLHHTIWAYHQYLAISPPWHILLILVSLCGLITCVSQHKYLLVHLSCHSITKTKQGTFNLHFLVIDDSSTKIWKLSTFQASTSHICKLLIWFGFYVTYPPLRPLVKDRISTREIRLGSDNSPNMCAQMIWFQAHTHAWIWNLWKC